MSGFLLSAFAKSFGVVCFTYGVLAGKHTRVVRYSRTRTLDWSDVGFLYTSHNPLYAPSPRYSLLFVATPRSDVLAKLRSVCLPYSILIATPLDRTRAILCVQHTQNMCTCTCTMYLYTQSNSTFYGYFYRIDFVRNLFWIGFWENLKYNSIL